MARRKAGTRRSKSATQVNKKTQFFTSLKIVHCSSLADFESEFKKCNFGGGFAKSEANFRTAFEGKSGLTWDEFMEAVSGEISQVIEGEVQKFRDDFGEALDTNGDGKVDFNEFVVHWMKSREQE